MGSGLLLLTSVVLPHDQIAWAATCTSISDCQAKIDANNRTVADLVSQATSYQDAINHLNAEIYQKQLAIDSSVAQQASLQRQIEDKQREIEHERQVLADDVKAIYLEGQITPAEMLATSKNLSDYVDKAEARRVVNNKLQETLKQIAALQQQLRQQKQQVDGLLAQQRSDEADLERAHAQQASLLAYNQSQQSTYNAQTAANQQELARRIAAQRLANSTGASYYFLRFPGTVGSDTPGVNDYPYAGSGFGMSTAPGCVDNDGPDRWGYCTRQCVSYAAWAVERSGRSAPRYYGNAKDWVSAAYRDGVAVYTSDPRPGDVAISTAGTWGHAMYVEAVSGNQIYVSQYNQQLTGEYSTQWRTWR